MTYRVTHAFLNSQMTQKDVHAANRPCSEEQCIPCRLMLHLMVPRAGLHWTAGTSYWVLDSSWDVCILPTPRILLAALTDQLDFGSTRALHRANAERAEAATRTFPLTAVLLSIHTRASWPQAEKPDLIWRVDRSTHLSSGQQVLRTNVLTDRAPEYTGARKQEAPSF